jgi:uncharacterized protein (TIGR03437 family)
MAQAQLSTNAYRALGQPDLNQNGINRVQGVEMYGPTAVALDARGGAVHLYVSDTHNNRVLAWGDVQSYQIGNAPAIVLGQPGPQYSSPMGIGAQGFNSPLGLVADPITGNLYVADYGNNRVLRFPNPFANPQRVQPDAVYGQPDFTSQGSNTGGIGPNSMSGPRFVAFDPAGNLWVADTGNHRVLRYNGAVLDSSTPEADVVLGQTDFLSGAANSGAPAVSASGFNTPSGLAFDSQGNLYVSDSANARVLKFAAPVISGAKAAVVLGQPNFTTNTVPPEPANTTLAGPVGLAVDASGSLYVAIPNDNRVLVFASTAASGAEAQRVLGQLDFNANQANPSSSPLASPQSFSAVSDVKLDPSGHVYVADSGNNRVLSFPQNSTTATEVWGQINFTANGANEVKATGVNTPFKIAIDYSQAPFPIYVSDTNNNRVLIWRNSIAFHTGDPADLVIGQPDLTTAVPNVDTRGSSTPSSTSLSAPKGIAVDAAGNLYVADSGNNRVLRYPQPVSQTGRITPDIVIGQANFTSAISAEIGASSLRAPAAVAIGPDGDLFVSDAGNNRVLDFAAGSGTNAVATRVYGQPNFSTLGAVSPASAQTLNAPQGIFIDASGTMYVADAGNNRVLIFPDTQHDPTAGAPAVLVLGQGSFSTVAAGGGSSGLRLPFDVGADSQGDILVADSGNNRVLVFPSMIFVALAGAPATAAVGQSSVNGTGANWNSLNGLATPQGLYGPVGIFVDRQDTLYAADSGNNRVLQYLKPLSVVPAGSLEAGAAVSSGGLVSMFGNGLSGTSTSATASTTPWPQVLAGREVVLNDILQAPLSSVSNSEIDIQVPYEAALGTQNITVRTADTGELIAGSSIIVENVSPSLFSGSSTPYAIQNFDGTINSATNPALRGSTINIFGTGQGPVSPTIADGAPAPANVSTIAVPTTDGATCLNNQPSVCVAVSTSFGAIQFSGLAPGLVGIWQITVQIPMTVSAGNAVPLRAVIDGVPSNIVTVALK